MPKDSFDQLTDNGFVDQDNPDRLSYFKESTSLRTAGFPNVITALVPGKDVKQLAEYLAQQLRQEWRGIAQKVREHIKKRGIEKVTKDEAVWSAISAEFASLDSSKEKEDNPYYQELQKLKQHGNWAWNQLWDAQIENTWETYWTAVPFGHPEKDLQINLKDEMTADQIPEWEQAQNQVAQPKQSQKVPNQVEKNFYEILNVGTWWPSLQSRLGQGIQSIKNTRSWSIPPAPGERSTLSGQFSAVHPNFLYDEKRREGGGLPVSSMRLFWRVMAELYPGLFNGSEKLNAIELTKRMAWEYGGVAESLGIEIKTEKEEIDYEQLIRFPNLSSIASARFTYDCPSKIRDFWTELEKLIRHELRNHRDKFGSRTRGRPFQVPKTDAKLKQTFNGVMFSSKWLADDMGLDKQDLETLRGLVDQAHKNTGFADGSPADWWVIVLGDGDSMGKYVSGSKLHEYEKYLVEDAVADEIRQTPEFAELCQAKKRMGPATHVGLNRALLDFSNRIVPHLTEKRFCGKVVYSGGDDVMAVLPLEDLPEYLRSLRAAWCGDKDPYREQSPDDVDVTFTNEGGYWQPSPTPTLSNQGVHTNFEFRPPSPPSPPSPPNLGGTGSQSPQPNIYSSDSPQGWGAGGAGDLGEKDPSPTPPFTNQGVHTNFEFRPPSPPSPPSPPNLGGTGSQSPQPNIYSSDSPQGWGAGGAGDLGEKDPSPTPPFTNQDVHTNFEFRPPSPPSPPNLGGTGSQSPQPNIYSSDSPQGWGAGGAGDLEDKDPSPTPTLSNQGVHTNFEFRPPSPPNLGGTGSQSPQPNIYSSDSPQGWGAGGAGDLEEKDPSPTPPFTNQDVHTNFEFRPPSPPNLGGTGSQSPQPNIYSSDSPQGWGAGGAGDLEDKDNLSVRGSLAKGRLGGDSGDLQGLPNRPLFTMGDGATMSMGIVIAYKSVPLPTVLETLWGAEKERAKKLPGKDGLCFRVIYGGGNVLEAVMKGTLFESWWQFMQYTTVDKDISPLLYRLSEELPRRADLTENYYLFRAAASVIWDKTQISEVLPETAKQALLTWLTEWEKWAWESRQWAKQQAEQSQPENPPLGTSPEDLGKLLRFSAFWVDKKLQREKWKQEENKK
jgi:hypothetical protein